MNATGVTMARACAKCGEADMKPGSATLELTRAGVTFVADVAAEVCPACNANAVDYKTLKAFELTAARWLATSGLHSSEAFKFMRKALGLKAQQLAALLGTTKETVSRWENGKHAIDRPAFAVLATLVVDTSKGRRTTLRKRLETMSTEPAPPPGPVRLEVAA